MSAATARGYVLGRQFLGLAGLRPLALCQQPNRNVWKPVNLPKPGVSGKSFRRIVHFPEKYTVEPLRVTNLAGRDPVTGRKVVQGIGGGIKHKYHWVEWRREGPKTLDEKPKEEKVLQILFDGCRTAHLALVGTGRDLKYIIATENMKAGDVIRTSNAIPRIPVRANEGDAYPLGALTLGTQVHCVEKVPGLGGFLIHAAGTWGTIQRRDGEDRVIVQMPSKKEFSLDKRCMATVGRVSNIMHGKTPVGSAQRMRELGNRPRSGLWHRKDGRHGRKTRAPPRVRVINPAKPVSPHVISLSLSSY